MKTTISYLESTIWALLDLFSAWKMDGPVSNIGVNMVIQEIISLKTGQIMSLDLETHVSRYS